MQIIKEQKIGEYYSSAVEISKDEWLEILKDESVSEKYKEAVICFYYTPDHKGSCVAVGNRLGKNAYSLVATIMNFGKYVQKRLGRFQVVDEDGKNTYWHISMKQGKALSNKEEGNFEWTLRDELAEAIREYLLWYLVECYKELRQEMPIRCTLDDVNWDELYKWELITACEDRTVFEIVKNHVNNPNKPKKGGFTNLIDAIHDNQTLSYLVKNEDKRLKDALDKLTDEFLPLNDRLASYKVTMTESLATTEFKSKANDERTAATILTCYNPEKYTFYKHDGMYDNLCKYLGEEMKPTGHCYQHYLEMVFSLSAIVAKDANLQSIVSPMLEGQRKSDLLLAQDMVWMLLCKFPNRLGFIQPLVWRNKKRLWLWGGDAETAKLDTLRCGSSAKTIKDFRQFKNKKQLTKAFQEDVGNQDVNLPTAYWNFVHEVSDGDYVVVFKSVEKGKKRVHLLYGWGKIVSECHYDETNDNPMFREVKWHKPFLLEPIEDPNMGNSLFFHGTTDNQARHIIEILNIETQDIDTMNLKHQEYINLLKANYNLILTGAPGTGKTYLAKQIAAQMMFGKEYDELSETERKENGFVQFHPSYDYTDFVEGLRPKEENGSVGFERRDGVFKGFCEQALSHSDRLFVFIIDEINRGEISKIFGELFYSIDPGYRGEKGRVDTQYQNMVKAGDVFEDGFFVPDNVYIIGTMNDIDRSVESMDFAMRRRFVWKEVTAEDSMQMLDGLADEEKLKNRMRNLNAAILEINGLGTAYQIGAAYFLKYEQYHDFELLWEYHLDGLLREYLRGNRNVDDEMKKLKKAYDNDSSSDVPADNDN